MGALIMRYTYLILLEFVVFIIGVQKGIIEAKKRSNGEMLDKTYVSNLIVSIPMFIVTVVCEICKIENPTCLYIMILISGIAAVIYGWYISKSSISE